MPAMTEKEWQSRVIDYAKVMGWRVMHQLHSIGTVAGWPDLVLLRRPHMLVVELKSEKGKLSPDQILWLADLEACGVTTFVWRPSDWDDVLKRLARNAS